MDAEEQLPLNPSPSCSSNSSRVHATRILPVAVVGCLTVAAVYSLAAARPKAEGAVLVDVGGDHHEEEHVRPSGLRSTLQRFSFDWLWGDERRPECRKRLERLEALDATEGRLRPGAKYDEDFPPTMASIGDGNFCGDEAHGIKDNCSKYNHWVPMREVAKRYYRNFSVFKPGGVQSQDIGQGRLGTCYFLGALASIANTAPQLIEDMFVRRELWKDNIFTTRWRILDQDTLIEVDGMIPASRDNVARFVQPSSTGEFWPSILEKAWAKIHTSFAAIEGGFWPMPVMAITRAPVRSSYHRSGLIAHLQDFLDIFRCVGEATLWEQMLEATRLNHPMGASTDSKTKSECQKYGLAADHLYAVFRAYESPDYGRVVDVYNPWHSDQYHGKVPNPDKKDGLFTMALDEYFEAFHVTYFAELIPSYQSTTKRIQHAHNNKWSHHIFDISIVPEGTPFFVSLVWPAHRLVRPCPKLDPETTLQVVKADKHGTPVSSLFHGQRDGRVINSVTAEVTAGPGRYHILANAEFDVGSFIRDVYLSVYAPEEVELRSLGRIADGDTFTYNPWGGLCVAKWHTGELWIRKLDFESNSSQHFFRTQKGAGQELVEGRLVTIEWEDTRQVRAQMIGEDRIRIDDGDFISFFHRAKPQPIPGSEDWWTCMHDRTYLCGEACCCDRSWWDQNLEECRPF